MSLILPTLPASTVMIVDDEPDNLNVLEAALSQAGYRLAVFPCGRLAFAAAQAVPPDLVLLDIRMPGMGGYDVCRRFKADERLHPIPIIFISAQSAAEDIATGFACGGVDYIAKPFREAEVLARVRNQLALRGAYSELAGQYEQIKRTQEELRVANGRLNGLIASREAELRAAVAAALDASAGESRRIGQEIHDGVCQELVGLLRMAEGLVLRSGGAEEARCRAVALSEQAGHVLRLARSVSYDLTLHDLETLTLCEALAVFARRFEGASGVAIELNCGLACGAFTPVAAEHVYRVVREAVVNALRHGKAQRIWIDVVREALQVVVSVTNDGLPLQRAGESSQGLGLQQMRMRAGQLGGIFSLRTNTLGQTVAELAVPNVTGRAANEQ